MVAVVRRTLTFTLDGSLSREMESATPAVTLLVGTLGARVGVVGSVGATGGEEDGWGEGDEGWIAMMMG